MSYASYKTQVAQTLKTMGIHSRTNRIKVEVRLTMVAPFESAELPKYLNVNVMRVFRAIQWGVTTGRLHASADAMVKEISGYQLAKLAVKLALAGYTDNEVVQYLRGEISVTI